MHDACTSRAVSIMRVASRQPSRLVGERGRCRFTVFISSHAPFALGAASAASSSALVQQLKSTFPSTPEMFCAIITALTFDSARVVRHKTANLSNDALNKIYALTDLMEVCGHAHPVPGCASVGVVEA